MDNQHEQLWFWALESLPSCFGPLNRCVSLLVWALKLLFIGPSCRKNYQ